MNGELQHCRRQSDATAPDGGGLGDVLLDAFVRRDGRVDGEVERALSVCAALEHPEAMEEKEEVPGTINPRRDLGRLDLFFADGVGFEVHVFAGLVERGREMIEDGEVRAAIDHFHDPENIAEVAPLGIEIKAAFLEGLAAEKNGAGKIGEAHPDVVFAGQKGFAAAQVVALRIHNNGVRENGVHRRVLLEEIVNGFERAGKVLLVAIQVGDDVAESAAETAVDGVVHALVFFDEGRDPAVLREPVLSAVIGAGVLDDVLDGDALLIRNGGNAEAEPVRVAETGRDDGKIHRVGSSFAAGLDAAMAGAGAR